MTVNFKSNVTSNNVNTAFVSKTADDEKTGKLSLNDTSGDSNPPINNTQKYINQIADTSGETEEDANRKNYATNNKIANGDSRKAAIEKLDVAVQINEDALTGINDSIGQPLGIASLDQNGKLPASQLTTSAFEYIGLFDADLCEPNLIDATTASFDAPILGVTGNVQIIADSFGTTGNALIVGDGLSDLDTLIGAYNGTNPDATITLVSLNGADIPDDLEEIQLTGGSFGEVTAIFNAPILGVTGNVQITADNFGIDGNVFLIGDGITDLQTLVDNFNNTLPSITITLLSANGTDVPDDLEVIQLSGGRDLNNSGDTYHVSVAGSCDFGNGSIEFNISDKVVYNGLKGQWEKWDTIDQVVEVNGYKGVVNLDSDDVPEGIENLYTQKDTKANLDALPRKEGKFYFATDEKKAYVDNGTDLIGIGSGGYEDATQPSFPLNQGVEQRFPDTATNAYPAGGFACAGYFGVSTGYTEPFTLNKIQNLTVEVTISNYIQGEGDPFFIPIIFNSGFGASIVGSTNTPITGDGVYSYTFTPAELGTLPLAIDTIVWDFNSNGVIVDTNANTSTTWVIDNFRVEQNATDWGNEDLSSIPAYLWNIGFNTSVNGWVSSSVQAPYRVTEDDENKILVASTAADNVEIILPEISSLILPFNFAVKKALDTVNTNTITVSASGADEFNFNNTTSLAIETGGAGYHLLADDSGNWVVLPFLEDNEAKIYNEILPLIPETTLDIDDNSNPQVAATNKYHIKQIGNYVTDLPSDPTSNGEFGSIYHASNGDFIGTLNKAQTSFNEPLAYGPYFTYFFTDYNPPAAEQVTQAQGWTFVYVAADIAAAEQARFVDGKIKSGGLIWIVSENELYNVGGGGDSSIDEWVLINKEQRTTGISLLASQTNTVITELNIDTNNYDGGEITYTLRASDDSISMGTMRVIYSPTVAPFVRLTDEKNELGNTDISFNAQLNGTTVEITYTSNLKTATLTAELKKLKI